MLEDEDDVLDSTEFSPKLGANFHFNENHTVKFVYSEALRTPDFLATERDWNYVFRDLDPPLDGMNEAVFFLRRDAESAGDDTLRPERIVAHEIIYQLLMTDMGLSAEVKAFRNSIDDAMTEDFGFFVINYSNEYSFDLEGYEAQINYQPTHKFITSLTYATMDNTADIFTENSLYADKSGSLSFRYAFNPNWRLALAHYAHHAGTSDFFDYRRSDLVIGYETSHDNSDIEATFIVRTQPKDQSAFARQESSVIRQYYNASTHYFLGLRFSL
jgi:iron complex outermembrane receptor protein